MMKAEAAIRALLIAHAPLLVEVPAARILPSMIPLGTTLPAIAYNFISGVPHKGIDMSTHLVRARIQVTVQAKNYVQQKQVIELIKTACDAKQGTIATYHIDSVLHDLDGPDLRDDDAGIHMQTVDFIVKY
jgi:hypothetical protein